MKNPLKSLFSRGAADYSCAAVICAAGSSQRMGEDKLKLRLDGVPVLARTLKVFDDCPEIREIIVVVREEELIETAQLCNDFDIHKATKILIGGSNRTESALFGVSEVGTRHNLIAIHDGARPMVTGDIITEAIDAAYKNLAAAPGIRLKDTVKSLSEGLADCTLAREAIVAVQTPQVFEADLIKAALTAAYRRGDEITDDCAAVEALGIEITITDGSEENIKITTPVDLLLAEAILKKRKEALELQEGLEGE